METRLAGRGRRVASSQQGECEQRGFRAGSREGPYPRRVLDARGDRLVVQGERDHVHTRTTHTVSSSSDLASAKIEPLRGFDKADSGYGLISWLLMASGVANPRKVSPGSPVS